MTEATDQGLPGHPGSFLQRASESETGPESAALASQLGKGGCDIMSQSPELLNRYLSVFHGGLCSDKSPLFDQSGLNSISGLC